MASRRKSPKATAAKRTAAADSGSSPVTPMMPKTSKHRKMLNQMQSTLSDLGQQIQTPMPGGDSYQTPPGMMPPGLAPNPAAAKQHVANLHKAFLDAAMSGKGTTTTTKEKK